MFLFRRRQARSRTILPLIMAVFALLSACGLLLFAVPAGYSEARDVEALPRPTTAELATLSPGTRALLTVTIAGDQPTAEGLTLYKVETRSTAEGESRSWTDSGDYSSKVQVAMADGTAGVVTVLPDTRFGNASTITTAAAADETERRYVGYTRSETITVDGRWDGDYLVTAEGLYRGTIDEYVEYIGDLPGNMLWAGLACLGFGIVLLIISGLSRLLGG